MCVFVPSLAPALPPHNVPAPGTGPAPLPHCAQASELCARNETRMEELVAAGRAQHEPLRLASRWATSLSTQRAWLVRRFFAVYWRMPEYSECTAVLHASQKCRGHLNLDPFF